MPTSITRICNPAHRAPARGFTLIEILVVLTLAAILTGVVVIGFTGAEGGQRLEGATERVMLRMDLARQRALQRNRELGMNIEPDRYRFSELERETGRWLALTERPFTEVILDEQFRLSLKVEGELLAADSKKRKQNKAKDEDDGPPPDLLFFRSGEVSPFTLTIETEDQRRAWTVSSDGLSGISMARVD